MWYFILYNKLLTIHFTEKKNLKYNQIFQIEWHYTFVMPKPSWDVTVLDSI